MEIFKELNKKGYKHYYEGTVEELDSMDKDNQHLHSEIMQVVMWLYDEHGVWIEGMHCGTFNDFTFKVSRLNKKNIKKEPHYMHDLGKGFNSPTDAYRAAIEYTLKNLI